MIKGKATIELFDAKTGELQQRTEDHNLVTNALKYVMNICAAEGADLDDQIFPIARVALGGILLFDDTLEESVDNVYMPTGNVHLVGYADRSVNTSDKHRGSYNSVESGKTDDGYKSVWDFGTSQANGTIKSIARTSNYAASDPICRYLGLAGKTRHGGMPSTDYGAWTPVRYDGEYVYMVRYDNNGKYYRLYRVRRNTQTMRVLDKSNMIEDYEQVGQIDDETYHFEYSYYSEAREVTGYTSGSGFIYDGHDGYLYCFSGGYEGSTNQCTVINWFTVKYSDDSWEKSEIHTFTTQAAYYGKVNSYYTGNKGNVYSSNLDDHACFRYSHGYVYLMSADRKKIIQVNLSNTVDQHLWTVISEGSDYIYNLQRLAPRNGGVPYTIYHYTTSGYEYRNGFLYEDGNQLLHEFAGSDAGPYNSSSQNWYYLPRCEDDKLAYFGRNYWSSEAYITNGYISNYLGTIANLSSPIEKNASQTMKITYTLIDQTTDTAGAEDTAGSDTAETEG